MKNVEIFWITSAYPFAFRWPWATLKFWKSRRRSQRWVRYSGYYVMIIVKVRVCDFNQWKIKDIWLAVDVRHSFSLHAEMQTKIWQKRIQNSRIGKTMWTLWGGSEEADLAKTASSSPVACIWQTRVKGATGHWAICVRGSILNKSP